MSTLAPEKTTEKLAAIQTEVEKLFSELRFLGELEFSIMDYVQEVIDGVFSGIALHLGIGENQIEQMKKSFEINVSDIEDGYKNGATGLLLKAMIKDYGKKVKKVIAYYYSVCYSVFYSLYVSIVCYRRFSI